eukprot:3586479-Prymnesium_polylepis.1
MNERGCVQVGLPVVLAIAACLHALVRTRGQTIERRFPSHQAPSALDVLLRLDDNVGAGLIGAPGHAVLQDPSVESRPEEQRVRRHEHKLERVTADGRAGVAGQLARSEIGQVRSEYSGRVRADRGVLLVDDDALMHDQEGARRIFQSVFDHHVDLGVLAVYGIGEDDANGRRGVAAVLATR